MIALSQPPETFAKQIEDMHKDMVKWVKETLESDHGSSLHDILFELRLLIEQGRSTNITRRNRKES